MHEIELVLKKKYQRADKLMVVILWLLLMVSFALSELHDTMLWAIVIGIPAALLPTFLSLTSPETLLTRAGMAVALN
jgi:methyl-accepting chemotaxis protein